VRHPLPPRQVRAHPSLLLHNTCACAGLVDVVYLAGFVIIKLQMAHFSSNKTKKDRVGAGWSLFYWWLEQNNKTKKTCPVNFNAF
jgi:hypothetical protein